MNTNHKQPSNPNNRRFRRTKRVLVGIGSVTLFSAILIWALRPKEPSYQDKSLSVWLKKFGDIESFNAFTGDFDLDETAAHAVREMGTPVTPQLIRQLEKGLSGGKTYNRLASWSVKWPFKLFSPLLDQRGLSGRQATLGFKALGEKGSDAVPELTKLIGKYDQDGGAEGWILNSLAYIGTPAIGSLSNALTSSNYNVRYHAASAVGLLREQGVSLVPLLITILTNSDAVRFERCAAARSIGMIGKPPELVLPVLCSFLSSTNDSVRENVVIGLMLMEKGVEPAILQIEAHLKTEEGKLDQTILWSLIILCNDDQRIATALKRNFHFPTIEQEKTKEQKLSAVSEIFAQVRKGWGQAGRDAREAMMRALRKLEPSEGSN